MKKLLTLFAFALVALTGNAQSCPDNNHPHAIDLGLPSGTKWACCNVGAGKPEGYGGYYAWGETEEKEVYKETTYQYATGVDTDGNGWYDYPNYAQYQSLGSDIAGTQYDVAHVKWRGTWQMPSKEQFTELCLEAVDNVEYITLNGVFGCKYIGPNGNSIFLPAAGIRESDSLCCAGSHGYYWSSTQGPSYLGYAYYYYFHLDYDYWSDYTGRYGGFTVRPVSINKIIEGDMDGDGEINVNDILSIVEIILGAKEMTGQDLTQGDMDGDGELTVSDIMKLVDIILGN